MTTPVLVTSVAALLVVLALVGVDIYWAADGIVGNTWSEVIRYWAQHFKLIAFAWGGLGGHFFHGNWWSLPPAHGIPLLLWFAVVAEVLALSTPMPMFVYFVLGAVVWAICWPV